MRNFEKKYKKFINSINLTDNEYYEIKNNIVLNNNHKIRFNLKYATILIFVIFISTVGIAYAAKIIENYTIVTNENLPIEESLGNTVISNARLNKDFSKNLFKKGEYYTYNEIEEKLGQKILKSQYCDSDLFVVNYIETEKEKIARSSFSLVNENKTNLACWSFGFVVKTNYFTGKSGLSVKGEIHYDKYYIESLNTNAIIVKTGHPIIEFTYENIAYEIVYGNYIDFDNQETVNKLYNFLESFTYN